MTDGREVRRAAIEALHAPTFSRFYNLRVEGRGEDIVDEGIFRSKATDRSQRRGVDTAAFQIGVVADVEAHYATPDHVIVILPYRKEAV